MKVVVIGGTGLIGSKLVPKLIAHGHEAVPAAPATGVNTITGEGLAEVLQDANVVVDVSNSPSLEGHLAMEFFTTSTRNLLSYGLAAGVAHHVALSVVGTNRLLDSDYFLAKMVQEDLIKGSSLPYSIVHATQFFEFLKTIASAATLDDEVHLAPVLFQPMAADDVASAVGRVAAGSAQNGIIEVAGPQVLRLDEAVAHGVDEFRDRRRVVADPQARYFGALLAERTLMPGPDAQLGEVDFNAWLKENSPRTHGVLVAGTHWQPPVAQP
jgi:uncharacterized protein YbjT (DUF2867 family)